MQTINVSDLPLIGEIDDMILDYAVICEISLRPFRIIKLELEFYRSHSLSLPTKHPDVRHMERMQLRSDRILRLVDCDCCGKSTLSVYDNGGEIYCDSCHHQLVYH